ncbi:TetR/AcrR family transcriptional regulator [Cellulomonas sp. DKR-3]|uniref:TetR/AcrR family transcriptional regulator n=1 Tax=Cellulomonas fulva TaxID=2835530 RepID=A0ABS5TX08_9CELL|nr:TetR/AcrR family transcriptional regulator [Cellulomonas fulva]MBT0993693.1 TetR/AcrR family transcriptional regulator [Cellulomonas fulva]
MTTKSRRTRQRIVECALELFAAQGYDATTVAQVAAAAGVTEMTFYRHIGTKEQLVVGDPYDPLITAAVARQPLGLPPLRRVTAGVRQAWHALPVDDEAAVRSRLALASVTPSLLPAVRASTAATERAVADQLVADGVAARDAVVAAAATLAALMAALLDWAGPAGAGVPLGDAVDGALDVLEAGVDR